MVSEWEMEVGKFPPVSEEVKKQCAEAIKQSQDIIRQAYKQFKPEDMAIAWTGGKDSTLSLYCWHKTCLEDGLKMPQVMTISEFDVFEEIDDFMTQIARAWELDLVWCTNQDLINAASGKLNNIVKVKDLNKRNQDELKRINFTEDSFPFEAESYTGNHLMKTVVFNKYIEDHSKKLMVQGLRRDEQTARAADEYFEKKEAANLIPEHTRVKPILHFTERMLWNTYATFPIPYCVLYERGYRSLGAKTTSNIAEPGVPAWKQDLEHTTERAGRRQDKEQMMGRLRKLGYM